MIADSLTNATAIPGLGISISTNGTETVMKAARITRRREVS
ncbi:MAG: hypothetical protein PWR16_370 [Methanoculleus sp.]|nr:hypothetical protein [Methanoculleus sp.]